MRAAGVLLTVFLAGSAGAQTPFLVPRAATGTPETAPPEPAPGIAAIPTARIAGEAMQLDHKLRSLPELLITNAALDALGRDVDRLGERVAEKSHATEARIRAGAVLSDLQQAEFDWLFLTQQVAETAGKLTEQATAVEAVGAALREDGARWAETLETVRREPSPDELVALTEKSARDIVAAESLVDAKRARLAAIQQSLAVHAAVVTREADDVRKAMVQSRASLLERDSSPIWRIREHTSDRLPRLRRETYGENLGRMVNYAQAKRGPLGLILLLTLVAGSVFVRLSRRKREGLDDVFARPYTMALLVGLVATIPLLYEAPKAFRGLVDLLSAIPVVRLLLPRLSPPLRRVPVALVLSGLTWELIKFLHLPDWLKRDLLAALCLMVSIRLWQITRASQRKEVERPHVALRIAVRAAFALIFASLLTNVLGYFRLSDLLAHGTLVSAYRGITLYMVFVVGSAVLAYVLRERAAGKPGKSPAARERLARRVSVALGSILLLLWVQTSLNLFTLKEAVFGSLRRALDYPIPIGSVTFSFSHVVAFALTMFFGYLIAAVVRVVLGETILPRFNLARGLPNAIATVTHYVAMFFIFLLALAAAGVELSKFTLLTGAVGVGLGFGLQNVVNNFVSGLILLFERPVRVGDFLQVGGVSGEVTKLGFRSSTLHSFDGSDLIIPNADLISQQVVNWTLTGTLRQARLAVDVAHGSDPRQVVELLRRTVSGNAQVVEYPRPAVLFLGYGDTAMNFEVRFWAPRPEVVGELSSEVALSVFAALGEAGIKLPTPQRDLHIRGLEHVARQVPASVEKD